MQGAIPSFRVWMFRHFMIDSACFLQFLHNGGRFLDTDELGAYRVMSKLFLLDVVTLSDSYADITEN